MDALDDGFNSSLVAPVKLDIDQEFHNQYTCLYGLLVTIFFGKSELRFGFVVPGATKDGDRSHGRDTHHPDSVSLFAS